MIFLNMSLKRLFRLGVFFLVFLICLMSFIPLLIEKNYQQEEVARNLQKIVTLQQLFIDNWLEEREKDIQTLASATAVKAGELHSMREFFTSFVDNSQDFAALVYVDRDGNAILDTASPSAPNVNLSDRQYFIDGKEGKAHISDVLISRNTGAPVIIFSVPVYNQQEEFQGVVFGPVVLRTIDNLMTKLQIGETGETYIIDNSGRLITKTQGRNSANEEMKALEVEISIPSQLLEGQSTSFYKNYQNLTVLGAHEWTNNNRWLIVGEIEKQEVLQPFYRTAWLTLLSSLLLFFISYLFISKVYQHIHRSISCVLKQARSINRGDYSAEVDISAINESPKEFQRLSAAFNEMAGTISATIANLEATKERLRKDISKRKEAEAKLSEANEILKELSLQDDLTKVANRRYFDERFADEWKIHLQAGKQIAIILFDLDAFKAYNDTYGHQSGDDCLRKIARAAKRAIEYSEGFIARYGGEEFIIILTETAKEEAILAAEMVRSEIENLVIPHVSSPVSDHVTVSVGVATCLPTSSIRAEALIADADKALYMAKSNGRNRVELYKG